MAGQYSNRQFFRQTPNCYLALFFEAKGIAIDSDTIQSNEKQVEVWQEVLNHLDDKQKASIEADFQGINALACEGGIIALVDEARYHGDEAFIEKIRTIECFHSKAMWAFLNQLDYWKGAARFLHADNVSASYWKKRNDLPNTPPHVEDEDIKSLADAISNFFYFQQGRGKNCKVEPYRRNHKEYFFAYPEDFAQSAIEWVNDALKPQARHPAFEIIFVYSEVDGSLDVYAPKNTKAIPKLQEIFAQQILKMDELAECSADKPVYELASVVDDDFEFKIAPTSGIDSVMITRLRVDLKQGGNRRITLEADTKKNPLAVYQLLDELNLPPYTVSQVTLKVTFEPVGNQPAKYKTFNVTPPHSCALHHDGNDLKIREMLARSGLEPAPVKV